MATHEIFIAQMELFALENNEYKHLCDVAILYRGSEVSVNRRVAFVFSARSISKETRDRNSKLRFMTRYTSVSGYNEAMFTP